jgi:hypothetical protein
MGTPSKAFAPTSRNRDPDSIVIEESDLHPTKHPSSKTSTDEGIIISIKPVPTNAILSIRDNIDPDSNVTEESNWHPPKHPSSNTSTDEGRMISIKPVRLNANFSIVTISILIQMKPRKVIHI